MSESLRSRSGCESACVSLRVRALGGVSYWDLGNPGQLCVCVRAHNDLYRQLERGCGLGGSYIQVSAAGETGIQGPAMSRMRLLVLSLFT